jgi:shikimate kinase
VGIGIGIGLILKIDFFKPLKINRLKNLCPYVFQKTMSPMSLCVSKKNQNLILRKMKISLIGMAGVGKSYWSAQLEAAGFLHLDLDDLIRQRLMAHLNLPLTTAPRFMNEWLNFPDSDGFAEREQLFVEMEAQVFQYALSVLEKTDAQTPVVINTGGSLIYSPTEYWKQLKSLTTIIYLKMDKTLSKSLINNYLQEGRSVVWKGMYVPKSGETRETTYLRCYSKLLDFRESYYEQYADCALEYPQHRASTMCLEQFLCLSK